MSATLQRDQVASLARSDPRKALEKARKISEPWFRAQALSWVARFTDKDPPPIASDAARAAADCDDDYKKAAVRAWEIAALGERGCTSKARKALGEALTLTKSVKPISSRSEALFLLLQAAFTIGREEANRVHELLRASCPPDEHWRCKRAIRDGEKLLLGELEPRPFFW